MIYTVKAGDTLSEIAQKHGCTLGELVSLNGIRNPHVINVGQVLQLPIERASVYNALVTCLDAIEDLQEFQTLLEVIRRD